MIEGPTLPTCAEARESLSHILDEYANSRRNPRNRGRTDREIRFSRHHTFQVEGDAVHFDKALSISGIVLKEVHASILDEIAEEFADLHFTVDMRRSGESYTAGMRDGTLVLRIVHVETGCGPCAHVGYEARPHSWVKEASTTEPSRDEIIALLKQAMSEAHARFAHLSDSRTSSAPAAPNTSRYSATRSAMVEMREAASTHHHSGTSRISPALIIGSLHDVKVPRAAYDTMIESITSRHPGTPIRQHCDGHVIEASDGPVFINWSFGTSYSTIGIEVGTA